MPSDALRALPSVSQLLESAPDLVATNGNARAAQALRDALESARAVARANGPVPDSAAIIGTARAALADAAEAAIPRRVINATGVIIHTNLGRAPLSAAAQRAILAVSGDYSALEYDITAGERGPRGGGVEALLRALTGAEAALVVNNCAGATTLMLAALAHGRGVVISRGQLIEIGGGFRVPDVLRQSGAKLVEVGTTNKVRAADYAAALADPDNDAIAVLRAHPSNFRMIGFTEEVPLDGLVGLARERATYTFALDDLGSGALLDTRAFGLAREPMVQDSVRAGADVVAFSGDKLLGGPQAGIMVGRKEAIERCRRHPLQRALRIDKFSMAALGATLLHYARGEAEREVPVVRMMAMPVSVIAARAAHIAEALEPWLAANGLAAEVIDGASTVGGGSLPGETLPTRVVALSGAQPQALARRLRHAPTPVISRIVDDRVTLDPRTVLDDEALIASIRAA